MNNKNYSFIYIIISIIDLYINYNDQYFPEYHDKRVKFNIICLLLYLTPFLIIISALCGPCCLCLYYLFLIIISFAGFYYAISSFYLYFAYDGSNRIKNPVIRIFLWIAFLTFLLELFSTCLGPLSKKKDSNDNELEEQNYDLIN